jgi:5-methylcytosine-specific restriction protein B
MPENIKPIQKILFGSPGTGKSYQIREIARDKLGIPLDDTTHTVKTVFHPEYTYADFMGKLLPLTQGNSVIYKFYPGHFIRILGMAYQGLIDGKKDHYLLVIDELNRGNAAAIFGTVFQLLDRESDGWSSYEVDISEMELVGLLEAMRLKPIIQDGTIEIKEGKTKIPCEDFCQRRKDELASENPDGSRVFSLLQQRRINIPHNLSILATINTSDESIYYLDSAFKRRWDWEYVNAPLENAIYSRIITKCEASNLLPGRGKSERMAILYCWNQSID